MTSRSALDDRGIRAAYSAHAGEMFGFAARSLTDRGLAEEAVQETFVRAWRFGDRYDPELGTLRTWLFSILRHVVIDMARARAIRPEPVSGEVIEIVSGREALSAEDRFDQTLLAWQVEEALRRIGEDHRRVLLETYFRARPYGEVAEELGIPEGTVKSRVYYALRALRLALEEMGWDDTSG
ncbi:MAG: sigma-70 family RNA polymerase sigma factor [Actinomycetota bacterium]